MSDFVNKYKNAAGGMSGKAQQKEAKKALTKALHQTFKMAAQGQVAGIQHNGVQYLMLKQDIFNNIIQNGGKMLLSQEQQDFHKEYQVLMHLMANLKIENPEEQVIFDEADQFTFEFSQFMNDPNAAKKRREILKEFHDFLDGNQLASSMAANLRKQLFPDQYQEEVENNGKLE